MNWRRPDLKYARNEIKFYIIEYINATISSLVRHPDIISRKGKVCDCSAYGTIRVQNHLSAMPQIVATLTGVEGVEGVFLHSCVDRTRYRSSRALQFIPLDGTFDVMKYSVKNAKTPELNFYCRPSVSWTRGEKGVWGTLEVTVGGKPKKNSEGNPGGGGGRARGDHAAERGDGREPDDERGEDDVQPGREEGDVGDRESAQGGHGDAEGACVLGGGSSGAEWGKRGGVRRRVEFDDENALRAAGEQRVGAEREQGDGGAREGRL